jgi:phage shock protein PspC (stress-responsive transcriptional regulator)
MTAPTPASHRVDTLLHDQRRARRPGKGGALRRARAGRRIGGVAAGIAAFVGADARLVRALWLVSLPLSLGITLFGYLLLWLLLPQE